MDGEGHGYTKGMVTMNSRPGAGKFYLSLKTDPNKKYQNAALPTIESGSVVAIRTFHGTFLQLLQKDTRHTTRHGFCWKGWLWFTVTIVPAV